MLTELNEQQDDFADFNNGLIRTASVRISWRLIEDLNCA